MSGLYSTDVFIRFAFLFHSILQGVCQRLCLWGVSLLGFQPSLIRFTSSFAFSLQPCFLVLLPSQANGAAEDILTKSAMLSSHLLCLSCHLFSACLAFSCFPHNPHHNPHTNLSTFPNIVVAPPTPTLLWLVIACTTSIYSGQLDGGATSWFIPLLLPTRCVYILLTVYPPLIAH